MAKDKMVEKGGGDVSDVENVTFGLHTKKTTSVTVEIPKQSRDQSEFIPLAKDVLMRI